MLMKHLDRTGKGTGLKGTEGYKIVPRASAKF